VNEKTVPLRRHIENPKCAACGKVLVDRPPNSTVCDQACGKELRDRLKGSR
jgi:hypothetical protein